MAILIVAALFLQGKVNDLSAKHGLEAGQYEASENTPILLLGGFRAIAIDLLWLRGIARHKEKRYFETMAINNLIAKLQPDFPGVWSFQAWNLAYNIAYEWKRPESKWHWIKAGLDFAEKGARKNPSNGDIAFELGYMYIHLFSDSYFKDAEYRVKMLAEESGRDNFEEAVYWLKASIERKPVMYNSATMQRMICHALWKASLRAESQGKLDKTIEYIEKSIDEWDMYLKKYPDDPMNKAKEFLPLIKQKKEYIIKQLTIKD